VTDTCRETCRGDVWLHPRSWPFVLALALAADELEVAAEYAKGIEIVMRWPEGEHVEDLVPVELATP